MSSLVLPSSSPADQRLTMHSVVVVTLIHAGLLGALLAPEVVPAQTPPATLLVHIATPREQPNPAPSANPAVTPAPAHRPKPQTAKKPETSASVAQANESLVSEDRRELPPEPIPAMAGTPVTQPRFDAAYLDNPAPVYPQLSRRLGEEGRVLLRVLVEADGRAAHIEIKAGSGSARLDQAAELAVRRWRFIPAKKGNEAIAAWVVVPISFQLNS